VTLVDSAVEQLCVNTVRSLSMDAVQKANSGHPGLPLGAAPLAQVLWQRHLRFHAAQPRWPDRDRFILSAGHGSMLQYALLHLYGFDVTLADLKNFRQWGSRTPGHPEVDQTAGVEATTGPLGQGTANAVGMAIAERALAHRFNQGGHSLIDHRTYALVSDGDLMEGIAAEAVSLAGHLRLGKLIFLYDSNDISLDGPISLTFSTEDVGARFRSCGWQVLKVEDGDHDLAAIDAAIEEGKADLSRPTLIEIKTTIGFGAPNKAGSADAHGSPLGDEEVTATKRALGLDPEQHFHVPDEVRNECQKAVARGAATHDRWRHALAAYRQEFPELAAEFDRSLRGELPQGFASDLPTFQQGDKLATRVAGGKILNALAAKVPELIGGDADLSCSTKTALNGQGSFDGQTGAGRNIHFGVREHAMGSIANGMALHGGVRPYTATFFVFSDYMRPSMRLAALSELPVAFVFTHDSIGVGEDGPTHQPIEHLMSLRAMPNLAVWRPADAIETAEAWQWILQRRDGPSALVLSRQGLPVLDRSDAQGDAARGAYVLQRGGESPDALLLATGSELHLAVAAAQQLQDQGIGARVISMPCWEAFRSQDSDYREAVLPSSVTVRIAIEAGASLGWERFVGSNGAVVGLDRFGASAPGDEVFRKLGFTAEQVATTVVQRLAEKG
jgi:transketolase